VIEFLSGFAMPITPELRGQIGLAVEMLGSAKSTFQKPKPTRNELIEAAIFIAWVLRRADKLGFRGKIQPALDEVRFAADAAAARCRKAVA
jgi:hypothetical protein